MIGKVEEPVAPPANQRVVVLDVTFHRADPNIVPDLGETIHVLNVDLLRTYEGASGFTQTPHAHRPSSTSSTAKAPGSRRAAALSASTRIQKFRH